MYDTAVVVVHCSMYCSIIQPPTCLQDMCGPVEHVDINLPTLKELRFINCDFVPHAIASLEASIAQCAAIEVPSRWTTSVVCCAHVNHQHAGARV